ncbi:hypothetical protein VTK73DRAFT_9530 [Phialemonium thermophilum]|uniref:RRM domain-containing protein n=1 Tax=Phialemonium thermophilum TaxID=223376 RepID=A0ABR3XK74_9PEZI
MTAAVAAPRPLSVIPTSPAASGPDPDTSYTRLHITPLDPDLLKVVLSSSILPKARNLSYHSLETFPEKRYGFVDLPADDADKVKRKLNGAVLKGVKIRIEKARPENRPVPLGDAAMAKDEGGKGRRDRATKKRKRSLTTTATAAASEEIPGVVLEPGRKVKRGWTVPEEVSRSRREKDRRDRTDKDKRKKGKKEIRSKYTDHAECLIKTKLHSAAEDVGEVDGKKKRKKSKTKETVVHEFERTVKFPTFLKTSDATASSTQRKSALEFVDGKGWVDEHGNVVEAVKPRKMVAVADRTSSLDKTVDKRTVLGKNETHSSSSDESSPSGSGPAESEEDELREEDDKEQGTPESQARDSSTAVDPRQARVQEAGTSKPTSSPPPKLLSIKIPPATPKVHPLEALYKRPKQDDSTPQAAGAGSSAAEPFSFFGDTQERSEDEEGGDGGASNGALQVPMTPYTRQDWEMRGIRSAAPTPDTAHPSRAFRTWDPEGEEDDIAEEDEKQVSTGGDDDAGPDDGEHEMASMQRGDQEGIEATSEFQRYFWEHRGDLNRAWKRRRKMAAKEKRYRENRARAERTV